MEKEDLIASNPLRVLGLDRKAEEGKQSLGLVMARAGLGKTAILVQIAIDSMMRGNKVIHVAIGESIEKTRDRYDDILSLIVKGLSGEDLAEVGKNRMIMTFKENVFSRAVLEERLKDLIQQDIFKPNCLVVDGYDFDGNGRLAMEELKQLMAALGISVIWFSAVRHRNDDRVSAGGVPAPCHAIDDLFDVVLLIKPEDELMKLDILKCAFTEVEPGTTLMLDPSSMLIKKS
ncbi:MAG: hypothetical protein V2I35_08485 [Desulfocapsaceae bacterium]|jgi:hypothetical protein|nr:hypothetical protein [Desulfocapsaceae bacterium]